MDFTVNKIAIIWWQICLIVYFVNEKKTVGICDLNGWYRRVFPKICALQTNNHKVLIKIFACKLNEEGKKE